MKATNYKNKIISGKRIEGIVKKIKNDNKTIVTTNGCFDIIHLGHIECLQKASSFCDVFIVGINSDKSVKKIKGTGRPINDEKTRAAFIASLGFVDYCVIFGEDTPLKLLEKIKPDVHVKGGDYAPSGLPEKKVVVEGGGKIKILPFVEGFSTSRVIKKIIKTNA